MDVIDVEGLDELHQGIRHLVHGVVHGHGPAGEAESHEIESDHVVFLRQQGDQIPPGIEALSQGVDQQQGLAIPQGDVVDGALFGPARPESGQLDGELLPD